MKPRRAGSHRRSTCERQEVDPLVVPTRREPDDGDLRRPSGPSRKPRGRSVRGCAPADGPSAPSHRGCHDRARSWTPAMASWRRHVERDGHLLFALIRTPSGSPPARGRRRSADPAVSDRGNGQARPREARTVSLGLPAYERSARRQVAGANPRTAEQTPNPRLIGDPCSPSPRITRPNRFQALRCGRLARLPQVRMSHQRRPARSAPV